MNKTQYLLWTNRRAYVLSFAAVIVISGFLFLIKSETRQRADRQIEPSHAHSFDLSLRTPPTNAGFSQNSPAPLSASKNGLSATASLSQGAILANEKTQILAEVKVHTPPHDDFEPRRAALAVVLDVSGSMQGEKIEQARRALNFLTRNMHDDDLIAVVTYSDNAQIFQTLASVREVRNGLLRRVNSIQALGGTNIPLALSRGLVLLDNAPEEYSRRLVLISDGLDHSGVPIDRVATRVRRYGLRGVTFSSLGVGTHYNEDLLMAVANAGMGNYEFLARGAELNQFLDRELSHAHSTQFDRVVALLHLPAHFRVAQVYGAEAQNDEGSIRIPIGSMRTDEQRSIVLALDIPASISSRAWSVPVSLTYHDVEMEDEIELDLGALSLQAVTNESEVRASRDDQRHADMMTTVIDTRQAGMIEQWREGNVSEAVAQSQLNINDLRQLQRQAYTKQRAERITEFQNDIRNFSNRSASSSEGRAYGLSSNSARRTRGRRGSQ